MPVLAAAPITRRSLLLATALLTTTATAVRAAPPVNTLKGSLFGGRADTAILGYDTVAYFTTGRAVEGNDSLAHTWMGATWRFSTQAHLDQFKAAPEKFAPQYGGYCAYGVSQGYLVGVEPDKFRIIGGKLYLNYNADVQATWNKDTAGHIRAADGKFQALLRK
ncbi:MAG: YHS domain-containing (seleno)protein [Aquabacterium sp.]|nr:YHS domain-containing (seleno)protein [Aquabacterium sp.]